MPLWLLYALLTALSESLKDLLSKRSLYKHNKYLVAWGTTFFATPFLLIPALSYDLIVYDSTFYLALISAAVLHLSANVLFLSALELSDISLSLPLISFTSVFLLFTSPLMIGEIPDLTGALGVILIVSGAYILNLDKSTSGLMAPFRSCVNHPGPRRMLAVAFIWSISGNLDRIGLNHSPKEIWLLYLNSTIAILLIPVVINKAGRTWKGSHKELTVTTFPIAFFYALSMIFYMQAISLNLIAYVVSIKRLSILIGIFWGYLFFKEKNIKQRGVAALIMLAGFALISVSG